jgi:maltoporin
MTTRTLLRIAAAAALALLASTASALDYHGYFRDSEGYNSKGGAMSCFSLPGSTFKARLGNECDHYLEVAFGEGGKVDGNEWRAEFMPALYQGFDGGGSGNLYVQQMWLGLKLADWGGAQLWAGRRYYRRHDVHSLDWFYWNPGQGNAGAGVDDINLGPAKLAVNVFRNDKSPSSTILPSQQFGTYLIADVRAYDIAVNPGGTLEAGIDLAMANDRKVGGVETLGAKRAGTSPLFTVQHNQADILGGSNTLALQYGSGAYASSDGDGGGQLNYKGLSGDKQWRIIEHLVINPTKEVSAALVLVYQDAKADGGGGGSLFSGEIRPAYQFNSYFKLEGDLFYQTLSYKDAPGAGSPSLMKLTVAPTFVLGSGYYARPVIRLFVTYASWNQAAADAGSIASGAFGTSKSGTNFGVNVESWF